MESLNTDVTSKIAGFLNRNDRYNLSLLSKNLNEKRKVWIQRIKLFSTWNLIINRWKFIIHFSKLKSYTPERMRTDDPNNEYLNNYCDLYDTDMFFSTSDETKKDIVIKAYMLRDYQHYDKNDTFNKIITEKMNGYKGNYFYQKINTLKNDIIKLKNKRYKNIYQFYNLFSFEDLSIMGF